MNETLRKTIDQRIELITKVIKQTEGKLRTMTKSQIKVSRQGGHPYYYSIDKDGRVKYLKKNESKLIGELLQKNYFEKVVKASKEELAALKRMKVIYPETVAEDVYGNLSEDRKYLVKPIIPTDEQFVSRWLAEPYTKKPISDDVPVYVTKKGERVRSKSEMIIANMLYDCGIPYKYECPVLVGGEIFHPDFTILRLSDRKIIYYEHCGRMGDPGYVEDMIDRSRKYALEGIFQGDKLFYTFESAKQPLDVRVVTAMIENNFR